MCLAAAVDTGSVLVRGYARQTTDVAETKCPALLDVWSRGMNEKAYAA